MSALLRNIRRTGTGARRSNEGLLVFVRIDIETAVEERNVMRLVRVSLACALVKFDAETGLGRNDDLAGREFEILAHNLLASGNVDRNCLKNMKIGN